MRKKVFMLDEIKLKLLLSLFYKEMDAIFKENLVEVILFGSYSTGNQEEDSDIDLMIFVTMNKFLIKEYREKVIDVVCNLGMTYDVVLSPIIQNYDEFQRFKNASGFFKNIVLQGVKISA